MNKPIKPNITIPESFAANGVKADFDSDLIASGFDRLNPRVLEGDSLNKFIDDTYQGLNYGMAAADAINLINEGETLTVKEGQLVSDKIGGGTGLQMFDTVLKDHILTYEETKGLALQGTYVYKEAIAGSRYGYPDFYTKCLEEYNEATNTETVNGVTVKVHSNGHKFYDIADKTAIDGYFNTMGLAWFYGIDTENERVFLPRDKYFTIKGTAPVVGNGNVLGFTNGTNGYVPYYNSAVGIAFDSTLPNLPVSLPGNTGGAAPVGPNPNYIGVSTDPTKSGLETHLQANEDKYLYICVGNTTNYEGVTDVVNQGMEILEQVALKVNVDGSNAEFPYIVETYENDKSWYRIWSNGLLEQGFYIEDSTVTSDTRYYNLLKPFNDDEEESGIGSYWGIGGSWQSYAIVSFSWVTNKRIAVHSLSHNGSATDCKGWFYVRGYMS